MTKSKTILAVLIALLAGLAPAGQSSAPDAAARSPIEGKWLVKNVGSADNHTDAGLDISKNERGELAASLYIEITNEYNLPFGVLTASPDGKYRAAGEEMAITPKDGKLLVENFIGDPVEMTRVDSLPSMPAPPSWPAGPGPRWRVLLGGSIFAPAAFRDGVAYVGTTDGVMYAVNVADGSKIWTFSAGRPIFGEALATDDAIFFISDNGWLYRLDRATGKEIWRYDLGDGRVSRVPPGPLVFDYDFHGARPTLSDGVLYIGAGDGGFHAVKAVDGSRVWRIQSNAKIRSTAAVAGDNVIFNTWDGWVCAVNRKSGAEAWSLKKATEYTSSPAVEGDVVVVGCRGSRLRGLDAATGTVRWMQEYWGSWIESTPVFRDGKGYIGSGDLFRVSCFDPKTGVNLWRTHVNGWVFEKPAVTDKAVFVGVSAGRRRNNLLVHQSSAVTALDRATGRVVWSWPMPEWPGHFLSGFFAAPTIAGDLVLAGGVDGTLYAFPNP